MVVWQCVVLCDPKWLCDSVCGPVSSKVVVWQCVVLCDPKWLCGSVCGLVSSKVVVLFSLWYCKFQSVCVIDFVIQ